MHTKLFKNLILLLNSQKLDENVKFDVELMCEKQKQIFLLFVAATSSSKFQMTSTTHEPSKVSTDGLGLQNTSSIDEPPNKDLETMHTYIVVKNLKCGMDF